MVEVQFDQVRCVVVVGVVGVGYLSHRLVATKIAHATEVLLAKFAVPKATLTLFSGEWWVEDYTLGYEIENQSLGKEILAAELDHVY